MKKTLTIVTPTYNRPLGLLKLYKTLKKQTNTNFCWWIIDDGSSVSYTETKNILEKSQDTFEIKFFKKDNGGKHRALNYILPLLKTDLTMIVDDDDTLPYYCVEKIFEYADEYLINNIKSMIFERSSDDGITPLVSLPNKIDYGKRHEYIIKNKIFGDFTDVFCTNELKEFRLPEFKNENFISEGSLYFEFSQKYDSIFIKEIMSIGGYHTNGLTDKIHEKMAQNINGSLYEINLYLGESTPLHYRIKKSVLYGFLMNRAGYSFARCFKKIPKGVIKLAIPIGFLLGKMR